MGVAQKIEVQPYRSGHKADSSLVWEGRIKIRSIKECRTDFTDDDDDDDDVLCLRDKNSKKNFANTLQNTKSNDDELHN